MTTVSNAVLQSQMGDAQAYMLRIMGTAFPGACSVHDGIAIPQEQIDMASVKAFADAEAEAIKKDPALIKHVVDHLYADLPIRRQLLAIMGSVRRSRYGRFDCRVLQAVVRVGIKWSPVYSYVQYYHEGVVRLLTPKHVEAIAQYIFDELWRMDCTDFQDAFASTEGRIAYLDELVKAETPNPVERAIEADLRIVSQSSNTPFFVKVPIAEIYKGMDASPITKEGVKDMMEVVYDREKVLETGKSNFLKHTTALEEVKIANAEAIGKYVDALKEQLLLNIKSTPKVPLIIGVIVDYSQTYKDSICRVEHAAGNTIDGTADVLWLLEDPVKVNAVTQRILGYTGA